MAGTARTIRTARPASRPAPEPEDVEDEDLFDETDRDDSDTSAELDEDDLFDDEDDDLESARSGYVTMDDLKGRLLVCKPIDIGTRESKIKGQDPYEYVINEAVIVVDGDETEMIEELPYVLEDFQLWGTNVVSTLKPKIRKNRAAADGDGKTAWVVGRLKTRKAKNFNTPAWYLEEPTEDDLADAQTALREFKASQRAKSSRGRR